MFRSEHTFKDFFSGALFAGALGAVTAIVLNTPKGKKLRKEWAQKYHQFTKKIDLSHAKKSPQAKFLKKKVELAKKAIQKINKKTAAFEREWNRTTKKRAVSKRKARIQKRARV